MAKFLSEKFAEIVVSVAVQKITDLLLSEADSLRSVRDDVLDLRQELEYIQGFLEHAEEKQDKDPRVKAWIVDVRDLACDIEDAIEIYIFKVRSSYSFNTFQHHRSFRNRVKSIKDKIQSICQRRQTYGIELTGSRNSSSGERTKLNRLRISSPLGEEDDVITLKDTTAALKAQLKIVEDQLCIVSIVGMGGLGKTTLAKKVYNDGDVKKDFDCRAWVFISQQCIAKEVLTEILIQVGFKYREDERGNSEEDRDTEESLEGKRKRRKIIKDLKDHELVDLLKNELKDKRYLVVLDDIWSSNDWGSVQAAFPKGKPGSKVLFTTRIMEVAKFADPDSCPIEPPLLTPTESWELLKHKVFARKAFRESDCRSQFEELGKEMVEKCGGLPLAIIVLGGLLRTKSSLDEWEQVRKHVKSHVICRLPPDRQYRVEDILNLSFIDLPSHLKPCFLYLGIFPEDSEIFKTKLVRLWIAEGFVTITNEAAEFGATRQEDVAEQYLGELVDRCMVQLSKVDHTSKGVKTCRLHDLMRDFCISKAKDNNFLEVMKLHEMNKRIPGSSSIQYPSAINSRRIAVYTDPRNRNHVPWVERVDRPLHSLVCHGLKTEDVSFLKNERFTLLRVLDFNFSDEARYDYARRRYLSVTLPKEIGNLIHLRQLKISGPYLDLQLPDCIVNLRNLHTLDLQGISKLYLPWIILTMRSLRHLLLPVYPHVCKIIKQNRIAKDSAKTENLETFKGIDGEDLSRNNAVISLTNIRKLHIKTFSQLEELELVLNSLSTHVDCLQYLRMEIFDKCEFEFPILELLFKRCKLARLRLGGKLSLKNFSFLPASLIKLDLHRSRFNQEKLMILEKLPSLRILRILDIGNNHRYKWVCSAGGFLKLEILTLTELDGLEEWEVKEGAMPILKMLSIDRVLELRVIPEGLQYVTNLCELNISNMEEGFVDRLKVNENGLEGEDRYKVGHIDSITFSNDSSF